MKILKQEELHKLPTHRLLALFKRVRKSVKLMYADITDCGVAPEFIEERKDEDYVKHCVELDKYQERIKSILNTREHVKRK
jgi:hypothetical protein